MRVLKERRKDIAQAVQSLSDAIGRMSLIAQAARAEIEHLPPGHADEKVALRLNRVVRHLVDAGGDLPNELWAILLDERHVGAAEVQEAFGRAVAGVPA